MASYSSDTRVFMDVTADGNGLGRLVFKTGVKDITEFRTILQKVRVAVQCVGPQSRNLNTDICPKTSENFRLLCTGERGFGYKGCIFYRVIPGFCACSGDFETQNEDRKGGRAAIAEKYFGDENFTLKHYKRGILSMDNYGWPNTNSSRFFVTFGEAPWMNNFHVAFGELVEGYDVLEEMEKLGILEGASYQKGRTTKRIIIKDCGQL